MAGHKQILVVEDEVDLAELIRYNLESDGFKARCVGDGNSALAEARRQPPDLVLLDRMLPARSGDSVAAEMKNDPRTSSVPIIMLTAKGEETDQLVGFALGADDYVTKPFSMKLLIARIHAALRRAEAGVPSAQAMTIGPVQLNEDRHEVRVDDQPVPVTTTEFRILQTLMSAQERVLDRDQLISRALGETVAVTDRTIDVHIAALRKKLGSAAAWIQTVRGVGYVFRAPR